LEIDRTGPESRVLITVRDHGPGVPEESLQAIFRAFYRIGSDSEGLSGNGLGLAIASEAIRLHRGSISASNLHTTGLEITIQVPIGSDATFAGHEQQTVNHRAAT
jgi:two-component system sensor histidine kinase CpxA